MNAPATAAANCAWNGTGCFGDAEVWNVGTNLAWLPTRDFEIGVEVIYARVSQDVRCSAAPVVGAPRALQVDRATSPVACASSATSDQASPGSPGWTSDGGGLRTALFCCRF